MLYVNTSKICSMPKMYTDLEEIPSMYQTSLPTDSHNAMLCNITTSQDGNLLVNFDFKKILLSLQICEKMHYG